MAHKDWLPGGRDDVLHLAKTWLSVLPGKAAFWNIPAQDITELTSYTDSADTILQKAKSGERTEVVSAQCRAVFDLLRGKLRHIKDRYLKRPPLTDANFPALLLKPPDTHPTPAPVPSGQVQITVRYLGQHLLELWLSPLDGESLSGGEALRDLRGDYAPRRGYAGRSGGNQALSNERWKDADSMKLLRRVWTDIRAAGWRLVNLDCVVSCEKPKILSRREEIRAGLARVLETEPDAVFVKGKTGEGMGPVGKGRAVEALAVCLLEKA